LVLALFRYIFICANAAKARHPGKEVAIASAAVLLDRRAARSPQHWRVREASE